MKKLSLALALGLALVSTGCGDDEKKDPCDAACSAAAKASCPNDDSKAICVSECKAFLAEPTCQAEAKALVSCFGRTTWTCDMDGYSDFVGCEEEGLAWMECLGGPN